MNKSKAYSKVVWSQGMFVQPQHFQQQERFLLHQLQHTISKLAPYHYGFSQLQINQSKLDLGEFELDMCSGSFIDGTSFVAPGADPLPTAINLSGVANGTIVYLALPKQQFEQCEVAEELTVDPQQRQSLVRYVKYQDTVSDLTTKRQVSADIELGQLAYRFITSNDRQQSGDEHQLTLAVARIQTVQGKKLILDDEFIPTVVDINQVQILKQSLDSIISMIAVRADELASFTNQKTSQVLGDTSMFMLLQMLNRHEPIFRHFQQMPYLHPVALYQQYISFLGEFCTFYHVKRRPVLTVDYQHDHLGDVLLPLIAEIKKQFKVVIEHRGSLLNISPPRNGIRAVRLTDKSILDKAQYILGIKAQVSEGMIRQQFPQLIKIAPGEDIERIIRNALPGIQISPLTNIPNEIKAEIGYVYFKIHTDSDMWRKLKQSQGMAIHISGDFRDLDLQLWQIKTTS